MANLVQLVFYGEVLAGHDAATGRERLAGLLKLDSNQLDAVFSGQRVVLRKNMSQAEAELYLLHMQHMGLLAHIEEAPPAVLPAVDSNTVPAPVVRAKPAVVVAAPVAAAPAPEPLPTPAPAPVYTPAPVVSDQAPPALTLELAADEMACPKCGERQPPRTLCRSCAVDMKRFVAAQQEAEEAERVERMIAREAMLSMRRGASPKLANVSSGDTPSIFGFGLSGRMGRSAFWAASFLTSAVLIMALLLSLKTQSSVPFYLAWALTVFYSIRIIVLRCHDREWTGWLFLLSFVPLVNLVFILLLLFLPGTADDNNYGEKPPSAGVLPPVGMFVFCCALTFTLMRPENQVGLMQMIMGNDAFASQGMTQEELQKLQELQEALQKSRSVR